MAAVAPVGLAHDYAGSHAAAALRLPPQQPLLLRLPRPLRLLGDGKAAPHTREDG